MLKKISLIFVGVCLFVYGIHPLTTFDTFFGLKIGETVVKTGQVPSKEIFSWSAYGRPIIAYEWLAQVWVYLLHAIGGLTALEIYVSLALVAFFFVSFTIFYRCFKQGFFLSLAMGLLQTTSIFEFFVARPQIIAFIGFVLLLYLIFQFIFNNKNSLFWSLPLTYIWTNSHASFIFIPFFFFSYAVLGYLYHRLHGSLVSSSRVFKTLGLFGVINTAITFAPPLFHTPYLLLLDFMKDLTFMTQFVQEWGTLGQNPTYQIFYILLVTVSIGVAVFFTLTRRLIFQRWLLALPLLLVIVASFQALRHIPLGTISCLLLIGLFLPLPTFPRKRRVLPMVTASLLIVLSLWLAYQKKIPINDTHWQYDSPALARDISFLKSAKLNGNMFNEFAVGGYLIYALYPTYQVFFDGRADIYHCCEMRDFWPLVVNKRASDEQFTHEVVTFLEKYNFSYMIISIFSFNPLEATAATRLVDTLMNDPNWRLVYLSDYFQVLVRNDGKNPTLYQAGYAQITPLRFQPFKSGQLALAESEYVRLLEINDSGLGEAGLGEVYLVQKKFELAANAFTKAVTLNPRLGRPYLGLAKIYNQQGNTDLAISSLHQAITISPYLGEAYLMLGQMYAQDKPEWTRQILTQGLEENIDFLSRQKIVQLLNTLSQ